MRLRYVAMECHPLFCPSFALLLLGAVSQANLVGLEPVLFQLRMLPPIGRREDLLNLVREQPVTAAQAADKAAKIAALAVEAHQWSTTIHAAVLSVLNAAGVPVRLLSYQDGAELGVRRALSWLGPLRGFSSTELRLVQSWGRRALFLVGGPMFGFDRSELQLLGKHRQKQ